LTNAIKKQPTTAIVDQANGPTTSPIIRHMNPNTKETKNTQMAIFAKRDGFGFDIIVLARRAC